MRKAIHVFGALLAVHLVLYGFTGLAFWGVGVSIPRVAALIAVHLVVFIFVVGDLLFKDIHA